MIKIIKSIIVTLILTLGASSLYAGAGHSHNVSEDKILRNAKGAVNKLVATDKLNKSWLDSKLLKMKKQNLSFGKEWKVSFKNDKVEDSTKQILYVYLTTYGQVKGVNYKGE
jgi:hypothetical protein